MKQISMYLIVLGLSILPKGEPKSREIRIGEQVWMSENLAVTSFRNADPLKYCWNAEEWIEALENERLAYTYYNFDPSLGAIHGCIYNYYALRDKRPLPPEGWRVPRFEDLKELNALDGNMAYFLRSKGNQKDGSGLWIHQDHSFQEFQDSFGFNALPSGQLMAFKSSGKVEFLGAGSEVTWWTKSKMPQAGSLQQCWTLRQGFGGMSLEIGRSSQLYSGHYVRCLRMKGY